MSSSPVWHSFVAVGCGAAVGAWARWGLGMLLNPLFPMVPLGTLAANLLGGLLMGVALAVVQAWAGLPPALKLFVMTGMLGGLTTFSTFSAEAFHLIQRQAWPWLAGLLTVHVAGSLLMTWAGFALVQHFRAAS